MTEVPLTEGTLVTAILILQLLPLILHLWPLDVVEAGERWNVGMTKRFIYKWHKVPLAMKCPLRLTYRFLPVH